MVALLCRVSAAAMCLCVLRTALCKCWWCWACLSNLTGLITAIHLSSGQYFCNISILLQWIPYSFMLLNCFYFVPLTPDTLETHKGSIFTSLLFWVFTFLWSRQHVIYFPPSLLCWWLTVLSIKYLRWEFAFKFKNYFHHPGVLKKLPWEQHLSLPPQYTSVFGFKEVWCVISDLLCLMNLESMAGSSAAL